MGRLDGFLHHWDGGDCTQCEANCIIIIFRLWIIKNLLWLIIIVIVLELEWNADGIGYMYIQAPLFSIGSSMVLLVLENSLRDHFGGMCTCTTDAETLIVKRERLNWLGFGHK